MSKTDIHETLWVVGSAHVSEVQRLLHKIFSDSKSNKFINSDEAEAYSATLLASNLTDKHSTTILEVSPLPLHLAKASGILTTLIERNMKIPRKETESFTTSIGNQQSMLRRKYRGKRVAKNNINLRGEFHLLFKRAFICAYSL
ncbi:Heat shock 70 kDa protein [Taenia solium]|eukprot:TsM_000950800 transcript=TsM_000950800 gene=TsM_000950800